MIVVDTPRLPRGRRALSTVNEHTVLKNDLPNSAQSTSMAHSGYDLKRSLSSPLQTDHDYSGMNEEKRDDIIVNRSHELRRSSSLLVKSPSSDRHIDNHPKSKFENSDHHVPDARVSASFKSSKKINRQLSEALLPKTTIAYDETVPDTVMIRNRGRLCTLVKKEAMLLLDTYTDQSGSFSNLRNGLFIVFFLGTLIGLWMPKNTDLPTPWYRLISSMIGYTYVVSWSICFYPQLITNVQRRSVVGLSTDSSIFQLVNLSAYATYCASFYFNDSIQHEYKEIHGENAQVMVESSDVVFSLHGSIMSVILVAQIFYFGGFRTTPVSKVTKYLLSIVFLVCSIYVALIMARTPGFLWIDFLYLLASIKMFLGIGSYMSQVLLNFTRKSTQGFNVWNIILDCTGGLLSLFQLIFDAADMKALRVGIMGNWAKLVVSLISLFFDGVLLSQHFFLYANMKTKSQEKKQELRIFSSDEENVIV